jgi:hypothetical protein
LCWARAAGALAELLRVRAHLVDGSLHGDAPAPHAEGAQAEPEPDADVDPPELTGEPLALSRAKADVPQADAAEGRPNSADFDRHPALSGRLLRSPAHDGTKTETGDQQGQQTTPGDSQGPSISPP